MTRTPLRRAPAAGPPAAVSPAAASPATVPSPGGSPAASPATVPAPAGVPAGSPAADLWADLLRTAAEDCLAALGRGADRDWAHPAYGLDWSCRETLDHLALGLVGYTGLLVARPTDRYITLLASLDPHAPVAGCLEGVGIAASLLASSVRDTPAGARAWHPWGHSDATGFAAMGITELVVHTYDITRALGVPWTPPDDLLPPVLTRIFPDAPAGHRPFGTLLWCTGRGPLPGLPRRTRWQWDGTVRSAAGEPRAGDGTRPV
ncbi:maleylpyruvate isomerase N-terminal domain-containing protein [Streptomyces pactum]|uniref:maleylpyruvate isomerase N-terminal domain-containing protein n=1 Tax=Streptomyces pactum TaxID=68249 RepID=UPI0027DB886A|nr:maleylpyruvate isomerase N-terminal domain-containing protein [Streptomyces pactum]